MGGIVGDERDFVDRRAALGGEARAFDGQVLDQHDGIARAEGDAVAVFVRGVLGGVVSPGLGFVVEVELSREVAGPVGVETFQGAGGKDACGGIVGPHGRGEGAEVVGLGLRVCAGGADVDGGVSRAAGDGGWLERGVCGCAEGAGHGGGVGWVVCKCNYCLKIQSVGTILNDAMLPFGLATKKRPVRFRFRSIKRYNIHYMWTTTRIEKPNWEKHDDQRTVGRH